MSMKKLFSNLKLPVIAAPMAGGINNPTMVAAVIKFGGIGSFGFAYYKPSDIADELCSIPIEALPFVNANFFIFTRPQFSDHEVVLAIDALQKRLQKPIQKPSSREDLLSYPDLNAQLEPIWDLKPGILTFHFGIPPVSIIERARGLGLLVGITATCLEEAFLLENAGVDFIVAQGNEAGGHRGVMDVDAFDERRTTLSLVASLKEAGISLPIVAAGGIMTGKDINTMITAGATAVQMGTAFITTAESSASPIHKQYLMQEKSRGTAYTKAFSGRYAQGIRNQFIDSMVEQPTLPFPVQYALTAPIRKQSMMDGSGELQALWCGSNYALCQDTSVAQLMEQLYNDMN